MLQMQGLEFLIQAAVRKLGASNSRLRGMNPHTLREDTGDAEVLVFHYTSDSSSGVLEGMAVFIHGTKKCVVTIVRWGFTKELPQTGVIIQVFSLGDAVRLHD